MASKDPYSVSGDPFMKDLNSLSGDGTQKAVARPSVLSQYTPRSTSAATAKDAQPGYAGTNLGSGALQPSMGNQPSSNAPIAYQPVTGNSLDQILRSMMNLLGGQGFSTFQSGNNILGSGLDTAQAGLNLQNMPIEFWQGLLSGDPSTSKFIQQAVSPEVSAIGDQYSQVGRQAAAGMPAGGYRASVMAGIPAAQARDVSGIYANYAKQIPEAAQQLSSISQQVSQTGLQAGQLGLGEQNVGVQQLVNALQAILSKAGINSNESMSNLANLTSGLETVFSALI